MVGGLAAVLLLAAFPAGAASGPAELGMLDATWAKVNDYQADIVADEFDGDQRQERRFHFSYLRPDHVKAEIVDGPLRGMVAIWNGGDKVIVYHHGVLAGVRVPFALHDHIVTSARGNTVASANFGEALACFDAHADYVRAQDGPEIDGLQTIELVLSGDSPIACPGYSDKDILAVTKDALVVDSHTNLPLRRLRYAGDTLLERWDIHDLRVNTGLTQADFR
jgi:outer membrane lipoprotein-sorting protein